MISAIRLSDDVRPVAATALRLALGLPPGQESSPDWSRVLDVARAERLAPLAWLKSGELIRESSPRALSDEWRMTWLRSLRRTEAALLSLEPVLKGLARTGVAPVFLKGPPLSERLYGDPGARDSADVDWFVPPAYRQLLDERARSLGWSLAEGNVGGDQTYSVPAIYGPIFLEVHSSLLHERLNYLSLPEPQGTAVAICGRDVLAFLDDPLLPAYLAVHLAGHRAPPLLWWVDLATLWSRLTPAARRVAKATARQRGLSRYLAWAIDRLARVHETAQGDCRAARALGLTRVGRVDVHPSVRHVRMAPTVHATIRAAGAWLLPSWAASGPESRIRVVVGRIRRHARDVVPRTRVYSRAWPSTLEARSLPRTAVGRDDGHPVERLLQKVRAVVEVGGELWVEGEGFSMRPVVQPGSQVLLGPVGRLRSGRVVLLALHNRALLHRIQHLRGTRLQTAGDACLQPDGEATRSQVVARAIVAKHGGALTALEPTTRFGWLPLGRFFFYEARRRAAHAVRALRPKASAPELPLRQA